jgi:UDP:flavonoid glycosyltransferase YjiC (YdhE family)
MAAEQAGVPYVALLNGYMTKHFAGVRTMSWRYPLYKYFHFLPGMLLDRLTKKGEALTFEKIHQPFAVLRRQYGLSKKVTYPDEMEGDLNFICDLPELFPQRALPPNYQHIPPLVYQAENGPDDLLKKLHPGKRTLFASMGSTGDWQHVSFLNQPHFQQYNIITAGDTAGVVQGPHVIRTPFAAIEPLFRHVDLVLCHGGNGTLYQCLLYGIPVLCKTAHFEQEWNVQALQQQGLGASLDAVKADAGYEKLIDAWSRKKSSPPFRAIQQSMHAAAALWEPAVARITALTQAVDKTLYYEPDLKSA